MSENENTGGAMGAGQSDAPDLEVGGGGDATGGGSMGDPDALGSDEELTIEEGSGLANPKDAVDTVMAVAPTLDRSQQEFMLTEVKRLMTAGKAAQNGLFWIDPDAVKTAHDFFLKYGVLSKPLDLAVAYDARFIESVPPAERML